MKTGIEKLVEIADALASSLETLKKIKELEDGGHIFLGVLPYQDIEITIHKLEKIGIE